MLRRENRVLRKDQKVCANCQCRFVKIPPADLMDQLLEEAWRHDYGLDYCPQCRRSFVKEMAEEALDYDPQA